MNMDLNSLACALAHKLPYAIREQAEAVIREAIEKTLPKWISVADELPPKDGSEVILRVRGGGLEGSVVAHWMPGGHCIQDHPPIDEGWYWWNERYFDLAPNPTHWMRLPEFPIRSLKQSNSGTTQPAKERG